ncbi:amidohydrolase [Maribacter algarum]|uniref:Amidohydrolase n=1 Tax=Maribacter algarum (ex Zhang et al. 2020) TaxID=2578118 RepID=A0A5S3PPY0_9FLAO|nr:amidohydrolase family protein [Maribacter algarum]TMM56800.1 amidohydrolase [Maribacter algarum]
MNWKKFFKWLKYIGLFFTVLLIIGGILLHRDGMRMYGGLTDHVEYNLFKPKTGTVVIKNVHLLSQEGDSLKANQNILIENGLITSIDSIINTSLEAIIIDGTGKYLIPGLIDTHVHLLQSPNDLLLYLANGVTEIRELIGESDHLKWRDEIENGRIGPKMHVYSPRIASFEPIEGWFMEYSQGYANIQNTTEAKEMVKKFHDEGYDGIKIYSQITPEVYDAVNETATDLKMPVVGHIPWKLKLTDIWVSNQKNIVHFEELMNALSREFKPDRELGGFFGEEEEFLKFVQLRITELTRKLVENQILLSSTLWLNESFARQPFEIKQILKEVELEYENPGISEGVSYIPQAIGWLPEINRYKLPEGLSEEKQKGYKKFWNAYARGCQLIASACIKNGVKIMAGTDANLPPVVPGFSLHDELISLHNAGMSNVQALQSATTIPAAYLKSKTGKIALGYEANLILLDKNPLENITNTKTINTVIKKGQVFDRDLLDSILNGVKEANDTSRKVDISQFQE